MQERTRKCVKWTSPPRECEEESTRECVCQYVRVRSSAGESATARAAQLKKAYYKIAMKEHPDKGGDKEKFQAVGAAYQVQPHTRE
eukprot:4712738-Pleurochrysis_carterae.AAC.1